MFICTNKGSILLKGVPSTTFKIVNVTQLIDSIKLAPDVSGEAIDAIVVTSDDVSSKMLLNRFIDTLKEKHPENVILYINKKSKGKNEESYPNVNYTLVKPTTDALRATLTEIISRSNKKAVGTLETETKDVSESTIPDFVAGVSVPEEELVQEQSTDTFDIPEPVKKYNEDMGVEVPVDTESTVQENEQSMADAMSGILNDTGSTDVKTETVAPEVKVSSYERLAPQSPEAINGLFAKVHSTPEIMQLINDLSLETILSDILDTNTTYEQLEGRVQTLSQNIDRIMCSADTTPTEEKLRRVRALGYERAKCMSPKVSIVEQYVEKIIMSLTDEALKAVTERVEEIQKIIVDARPTAGTLSSADILVLKENRSNALIELEMFLAELSAIETGLRKLATETATAMITDCFDVTQDYRVNEVLKREGVPFITEETAEALKSLYETLSKLPDQFSAVVNLVKTTKSVIHKVLDIDSRLIEKLETAVERLSLSQISKSALAKDIIGRTSRVFIGSKGSGRSIIPYLFATMHSRENGNVLYVNLCAEDALSRYGVKSTTLGEFVLNPIREDISVVSGVIDSANPIEEVAGALQKASSFYKAIYLVVPDDNIEAIEVFTDAALAMYVVCNPAQGDFSSISGILNRVSLKPCLKNVVLNKYSNVTASSVNLLGLELESDVTCFAIKHMDMIVSAAMDGVDPSSLPSIHTFFQTLRKYV